MSNSTTENGTTTSTQNTTAPTVALTDADAQQLVGAVSKHWGVLLSFGIVLGGLGISMMVWPQITVGIAAILLAVSLIISGVFSLVASFTQPDQQTSSRVLMAISGALSIGLGLVAFRGISQAAAILALIVGVGWVLRGILDLVTGISAKGVPGRGLVITSGIIGLLAGGAMLFWPAITMTALVWIAGLSLVAVGVVQIVGAFKLRTIARTVDLDGRLTA